jgi:hypothetical protein
MNPRYGYLIEPLGSAYNNTKNIAGVDLVVNTTIEDAAFVNRIGVVKGLPTTEQDVELQIGDTVVVHHNVFRTYLNMKGQQTKSNEFFRDNSYIVPLERIYLYKRKDDWKALKSYCFVLPVDYSQNSDILRNKEKEDHVGLVEVSNEYLQSKGVSKGSKIGFTKNSEYEFEIEGKKLYRMQTRDICAMITETR